MWNLFRHDGDRDAVVKLLPVVERVLRWFEPYLDEHGTLSDVPEWNLIDWASVFASHRSALTTGLWARSLAEYAEMADWLGNTASAGWARAHWQRTRDGFEDFWDPARGSYVDHIVDGRRMPAMSQAAGAVAIVSGLAPPERWTGIVDVITDPARVVVRSWIGGDDGGYEMTKIVEQSEGIYRIDWDVDREIVMARPFPHQRSHLVRPRRHTGRTRLHHRPSRPQTRRNRPPRRNRPHPARTGHRRRPRRNAHRRQPGPRALHRPR